MREVTINQNDAKQRLDKFITKCMPSLPKGILYKGFRKNFVKVNGKHIKSGEYMLCEGDVLNLYFKDEFFEEERYFIPSDAELDIVYEDGNILIINKPRGMVVHSDDKVTADTLIDAVKSYLYRSGEFNPKSEHSFSPSLCNRLDRNTSGLIIAAKNAPVLRFINEKIKSREIKKLYLCEAEGIFDKKEDTLLSNLTRYEKHVKLTDSKTEASKQICTKYKVIAEKNSTSLLEIELITGRTHQIRAQLGAISHPLLGDAKYGSKAKQRLYNLCSYKLIFDFLPSDTPFDYLCGKEFSISCDFEKKFFSQNS